MSEIHTAFIGIGANLGNPLLQCQCAVELIADLSKTRVAACSSFYHSAPMVPEGEDASGFPWYVNVVCQVATSLQTDELFHELQHIEKKMGRTRHKKWESRVIDLDLLFYDDLILENTKLCLPHPGIQDRLFVLKPMSEIAPDWAHPVLKKRIVEILRERSQNNFLHG